jgi:hypothetical protein
VKLALKLALAILPGSLAVIATAAVLDLRRDSADFEADQRADDLAIARMLADTVGRTWEDGGRARALAEDLEGLEAPASDERPALEAVALQRRRRGAAGAAGAGGVVGRELVVQAFVGHSTRHHPSPSTRGCERPGTRYGPNVQRRGGRYRVDTRMTVGWAPSDPGARRRPSVHVNSTGCSQAGSGEVP